MFAIRNGLRQTSRLSGAVVRPYSNIIVSAPPEVKISVGEKLLAFFSIGGAMLFWPMYFAPRFAKWYNQPKQH